MPGCVEDVGPPGTGKSTLGRYLADAHDFRFVDGDDWLPADMVASLEQGHGFTEAQRERFAAIVVERLEALKASEARPIAVAQALLRERHRATVKAAHGDVLFVRAEAPAEEVALRLGLGRNLVDEDLGGRMRATLEISPEDPVVEYGREKRSVYSQLEDILEGVGLL